MQTFHIIILYASDKLYILYRWFVTYKTRFSQVVSYTGRSIIYVTITKCNNFTYIQQIFFIYVLNCCWINEIYVKKNVTGKYIMLLLIIKVLSNLYYITQLVYGEQRTFQKLIPFKIGPQDCILGLQRTLPI